MAKKLLNLDYYQTVLLNRATLGTEADSDLTCQSGAQWNQINDVLKERGVKLFFPVSKGGGLD